MKNKSNPFLLARMRAPSAVSRPILFAAGAVAGAVIAATASYGVVSALYPRQAAPATLASIQPKTVLPDERLRESQVIPRIQHAAVPGDPRIDVIALAVVPATPTPPAPRAAPAPVRPVITQIEPAPAALPAPGGDLVIATKSSPLLFLPAPVAPDDTPVVASVAADIPDRARSAPALRPDLTEEATPAAVAALTQDDSAATIDTTRGVASGTPEITPARLPRTRPMARPDNLPVVAAVATMADATSPVPGIRPQPRPAHLVLAASRTARATGRTAVGDLCGPSLAQSIPRRPSDASGGADFFAAHGALSGPERDARVVGELARGNVPDFLRRLQPVTFRGQDARGKDAEIVVCVTSDYLAIGSDHDYVRVPLGLPAAARIAGRFSMFLPTPRMVDAIYAQADVQLAPSPMQPGPQMSSTDYLLRHNDTIARQLGNRHGLVAGQKKDVVMASRMASAPGRVAIYGWHRSATSPIQPVSTVHGKNYADYSHGIRLVSKTAYLNGRAVDLDDLLGSGRYAYLLNKEGPLPGPVIRTASR